MNTSELEAKIEKLMQRIEEMDELHAKAMDHSCECADSECACRHCDPSIHLSHLASKTDAESDAWWGRLHRRITELEAALTDIRDMPEYDQDDAHRLRYKAKQALSADPTL